MRLRPNRVPSMAANITVCRQLLCRRVEERVRETHMKLRTHLNEEVAIRIFFAIVLRVAEYVGPNDLFLSFKVLVQSGIHVSKEQFGPMGRA